MNASILDLNKLSSGMWYRLVSNAGYFCKTAQYIGPAGPHATFRDTEGKLHYVSTPMLWAEDNPVRILPIVNT